MASAGRVLLIFKGDYDNAVQYQKMDAVAYQGSSYVCKQTTTGNAPTNTTYWQILARGATDALGLAYDNTESGLNAENVQDAIDELNSELTIEPIAFTPSPNLSSDITITKAVGYRIGKICNLHIEASHLTGFNSGDKTELGTFNLNLSRDIPVTRSKATKEAIYNFSIRGNQYSGRVDLYTSTTGITTVSVDITFIET